MNEDHSISSYQPAAKNINITNFNTITNFNNNTNFDNNNNNTLDENNLKR